MYESAAIVKGSCLFVPRKSKVDILRKSKVDGGGKLIKESLPLSYLFKD